MRLRRLVGPQTLRTERRAAHGGRPAAPSAAAFPGGESMRHMHHRAAGAVRTWNTRIAEEHGEDAAYVLCTHGDIIKSLVADALGLHLDLFQRISVQPCSVTAIRFTRLRPFLVRLGDTGDLDSLAPRPATGEDAGRATVGGGTGAP